MIRATFPFNNNQKQILHKSSHLRLNQEKPPDKDKMSMVLSYLE